MANPRGWPVATEINGWSISIYGYNSADVGGGIASLKNSPQFRHQKVRRISGALACHTRAFSTRWARAGLEDPQDATKFALLFANRHEEDILLRAELDALAAAHGDRLKLAYCLSRPPKAWAGYSGHINSEMIRETMWRDVGGPAEQLALQCGPPAMEQECGLPGLVAIGYDKSNVLSF